MKIMGLEFAPLNIPMSRRLQTLAMAIWIVLMGLGNPLFTIFSIYVLLFTQTMRYFLLVYFIWMFYDKKTPETGGRGESVVQWTRSWILWRYFYEYFPLKLEKTVDLDPNRNYLFCSFPHGILSMGFFGTLATKFGNFSDKFPGLQVRVITLAEHFKVPIYRELALALGGCSANANSIQYLLSNKPKGKETGRAVVLVVGGASEALESRPATYRLLLKKRRGFVRMALKNGVPLVPVFSFGEPDLYDQPEAVEGSRLLSFQKTFQKLTGMVPVIALGRGLFQYSFGILPHRRPVTVVVGKPVEVPKISEPTAEQVKEYHELFSKELIQLFETHKHKYIKNADNVFIQTDF